MIKDSDRMNGYYFGSADLITKTRVNMATRLLLIYSFINGNQAKNMRVFQLTYLLTDRNTFIRDSLFVLILCCHSNNSITDPLLSLVSVGNNIQPGSPGPTLLDPGLHLSIVAGTAGPADIQPIPRFVRQIQ